MQHAFDLSALQGLIKKHPKYKDLGRLIGRFVSARSFRADLHSAVNSLHQLIETHSSDALARQFVGRALMTHAIVLYCRAAIEDGNGRFKMGVTKDFTAEQMEKHRDVVRLRNKSIAHFDTGDGRYGKAWIDERAVLKLQGAKGAVADVALRTNYLRELVADLLELCEAAIKRVDPATEEARRQVAEMIFVTLRGDEKFAELLIACPFYPSSYFSTLEIVEDFWRGGDFGHEVHTPRGEFNAQTGPTQSTKLI